RTATPPSYTLSLHDALPICLQGWLMARVQARYAAPHALEVDNGLRPVVIESVKPQVDRGRYAIKRTPGETVVVEADIFADGHDRSEEHTSELQSRFDLVCRL